MQFIKTLFWVLLAVLLFAFSYNNWLSVTVVIWDQTLLDTKLPILVIGSFLLGFLPIWIVYRTHRWRTNRRIESLESRTKLMVPAGNDKKGNKKDKLKSSTDSETPLTVD